MMVPRGVGPARLGRFLVVAAMLLSGCSAGSDPSPGPAAETPGPDTDPLSGTITPELVGVDPCALLTDAEVADFAGGSVTSTEDTQTTTQARQCTWRDGNQMVISVRVAARAADLVDTLAENVWTGVVEEVLGLPGPAVLAVDTPVGPDAAQRSAFGVVVDLGGGFHLTVASGTPLEIASDAWEAYLELVRLAAPRVDPT